MSLFKLTDLGEISYYLGVPFEWHGKVMSVHQAAYCGRLLERFGMEKEKSKPTSIVDNIENRLEERTTSEAGQSSSHRFPYLELLGEYTVHDYTHLTRHYI